MSSVKLELIAIQSGDLLRSQMRDVSILVLVIVEHYKEGQTIA